MVGADDNILELQPEVLALMSTAEINAFYKARGFKSVSNRRAQPGSRTGTPTSAGVRAQGEKPQPGARLKCANCNRDGHIAADCRQPKVTSDMRRCHNCNKTGHIARYCKEPKAKSAMTVDT